MTALHFTDTEGANAILSSNPFALLVGMTLYQQVPVEKAFAGPAVIEERLGHPLTASAVAECDPAELEAIFRGPPAVHRFPANMAKRVQAVGVFMVDAYGGDTTKLWDGVSTAEELAARIHQIPGFGDYKTQVYAAVLARQFGVTPTGWDEHLPDWPNISEVGSDADRVEMKARKKAWKEAGGSE
jgi:uncharacterized HhH-GPD family protein